MGVPQADAVRPHLCALQCDAIEAAQQEEALEAMQRWDSRFELRSKSLPELRALAQ